MKKVRRNQLPILIGLQFFHSGFSLIMGLTLLGKISATGLASAHPVVPVIGVLGVGLGFGVILFGFLLGYGLMKRWGWIWAATLIFHILNLLGTIDGGISLFKMFAHHATSYPNLPLPSGSGNGIFLLMFQLMISGSIVEALFRVRKEFQNQGTSNRTGNLS